MSYGAKGYASGVSALEKNAVVIDLRSDTLTKPTESMKKAMLNAEVGDDVYEEDPTVKQLEGKAAMLMGHEAALFTTSGTMGNLIAIMVHCDSRGSEAYCGEESHTILHEQCGAAQLGGVSLYPIPNDPDGTFPLKKLESKLRTDRLHEPISKLIIAENTINGKVVPLSWINDLATLAKKRNLKMHLDGARIWNASVASGISAKDIACVFDSVTFCLSKGLGAPVGSVLCGSQDFIRKARRIRKVLGGGMRQVGILAAAGLVALEEIVPLLKEDHRRAMTFGNAIYDMNSKICNVDKSTLQTNMVFVNLNPVLLPSYTLAQRLRQVQENIEDDKVLIKALTLTDSCIRFVFYHEIDDDMLKLAIRKITYVIKELDNQTSL